MDASARAVGDDNAALSVHEVAVSDAQYEALRANLLLLLFGEDVFLAAWVEVDPATPVEVECVLDEVAAGMEGRVFRNATAHEVLEFVEMNCIDVARCATVVMADFRRHSHHFAELAERAHDADGREGDMRAADVATRQEKVVAVAGVEAAVGDGRRVAGAAVVGGRPERLLELADVLRVGEVKVYVPGDAGGVILVADVVLHVVLCEDVVADSAVAFALAADGRNPVEDAVREFRASRRLVLEPVPV